MPHTATWGGVTDTHAPHLEGAGAVGTGNGNGNGNSNGDGRSVGSGAWGTRMGSKRDLRVLSPCDLDDEGGDASHSTRLNHSPLSCPDSPHAPPSYDMRRMTVTTVLPEGGGGSGANGESGKDGERGEHGESSAGGKGGKGGAGTGSVDGAGGKMPPPKTLAISVSASPRRNGAEGGEGGEDGEEGDEVGEEGDGDIVGGSGSGMMGGSTGIGQVTMNMGVGAITVADMRRWDLDVFMLGDDQKMAMVELMFDEFQLVDRLGLDRGKVREG